MLSARTMFYEKGNVDSHTAQVERYRKGDTGLNTLTNLDKSFNELYNKFEYTNDLDEKKYAKTLRQRINFHTSYTKQTPAQRDAKNARRRDARARKKTAEQEKNTHQP